MTLSNPSCLIVLLPLIIMVQATATATIPQYAAMIFPSNKRHVTSRRNILPLIAGTTAGIFMPATDDNAALANSIPPSTPPQSIPGVGMSVPLQPVIVENTNMNPEPTTRLNTKLGQTRIAARELSPLNPSLSPFAENDIYYPLFMFGTWNVTATLRRKVYPYGTQYVPSNSLIEGSPRFRGESAGDTTSYQVKYYSLGDDDDGKKGRVVNIGETSKTKIISDRRFNAISSSAAYKQLTPVQDVTWDPQKDPTRLTLSFGAGPLTDDFMPLGQRRAEVYVTARQKEDTTTTGGSSTFAASERTRQVTLVPGNVIVADTETVTEYQLIEDGHIKAVSRIAVFLTPNPNSREGVLWQQVGGKSVAFFDYELEMYRCGGGTSDDEVGKDVKCCVTAPKGSIQCIK